MEQERIDRVNPNGFDGLVHRASLARVDRLGVLALGLLTLISVPRNECRAADALDGHHEEKLRFFREKIEPVLEERCYSCHSAQDQMFEGHLQLDSQAGMLQGGDSGPAVVPGKPEESLVLRAIRHQDLAMPPDEERLDEEVIASFAQWIATGAIDPRDGEPVAVDRYDWNQARDFWSFQPVRRFAPPEVRESTWPRNWIDSFVLQRLEAEGLAPAPSASPSELVRRLYFDLLGIPPSPQEIEEFLSDSSDDAFERLVDRLLANPHFGERWGQSWLDVVRFAETEGFEYDGHLPGAWRYRDYVIRAFNQDKPFDLFVREQLAGDQLAPDDEDSLAAAIFHRLGPVRRNAGNPEIALSRNEILTERTDILGAAFLGLTVGCARCHDHKLDPIPQADYYQLQAFVAATAEANIKLSEEAMIPSVRDDPQARTVIHLLRRGQEELKGDQVEPRTLTVLSRPQSASHPAEDPQLRQHLAAWLTDREHPLTPRVYVNRIWQHYFGRGLVGTPNDFGSHGERPSHPELLDSLADDLLRHDGHAKSIHRLIVRSSTYRQSSDSPIVRQARQIDPENRWLWHKSRRRLTAEEIRDTVLMAAGLLQLDVGGPSVMVPVDQELVDLLYKPSQWEVASDRRQHFRRSIYLINKRNLRLPMLEVFDQPSAQTSCGRRDATTHARQALELLNGELTNEAARHFADRLRQNVPSGGGYREGTRQENCQENRELVDRAFITVCGRPPTEAERELSRQFLEENPLEEFALALLNFHGFLYVD